MLQSVAEMQNARDVGRRNGDDKRRFTVLGLARRANVVFEPERAPFGLDGFGIEGGRHFLIGFGHEISGGKFNEERKSPDSSFGVFGK
jgi:hypothetical protein